MIRYSPDNVLQSQLLEATSIIATLKATTHETVVTEPAEVCETGLSNRSENNEIAKVDEEQDVPKLEDETTSLSPVSDFSFVQPHSVTLEVEDDTRLEVEPSSFVSSEVSSC